MDNNSEEWIYKGSPFLNYGPHVQLEKYEKPLDPNYINESTTDACTQQLNPLIIKSSKSDLNKNKNYYENTNIIFISNQGYKYRIKEYNSSNNVIVEFIHNGFLVKSNMDSIKRGNVKYPYHPDRYGAYMGVGKYNSIGEYKKVHSIWAHIFLRIENPDNLNRLKTYQNVKIHFDWYNYQNFADWYVKYIQSLNSDLKNEYQLDKDILQWESKEKIYGPYTCCLVPCIINVALSSNIIEDNKYVSVIKCKNCVSDRYTSSIRIFGKRVYLGSYDTEIEAFNAYKIAKEKYIRDLADFYYSIKAIHKNVYDILYRINIQPNGSKMLYK